MQTKEMRVDQLSQDPANARKHDDRNIEAIVASLRRFGQQHPIIVDASGVVRAGNGRLEAARRLGWETIQVIETTLTGSDATAFAIADNRTAELAEWDDEILRATLEGLRFEDEELLDAAGFTDEDLAELMADIELDDDAAIIEDEVPEPPVDPITKPGDLWILGRHRVLCGDSTKAESWENLQLPKTGGCGITSPPYALGKRANISGRGKQDGAYTEHDDTSPEATSKIWNESLEQCLSRVDAACVNVQMLSKTRVFMCEFFHKWRSRLIDIAIWDKNHGQPAMAAGVFNSRFEFLLFFSCADNPSRRIPLSSWRGTVDNVHNGSPVKQNEFWKEHAATFPMHLPEFAMSAFDSAEWFVDWFSGTGTTLIAAEQLGRTCYGMEISPQYCDVIVKRWENLTGEKAVCRSAIPE